MRRQKKFPPAWAALILATLLISCTDEEDPGEHLTRHDVSGEGVACLSKNVLDEDQAYTCSHIGDARDSEERADDFETLLADQPLHINVMFTLHGSNFVNKHASCDVQVEGNTLTVTSHASYDIPDLIFPIVDHMTARCQTPPLPPGHGRYSTATGPPRSSSPRTPTNARFPASTHSRTKSEPDPRS